MECFARAWFMVSCVRENSVISRDSGEVAMWVAIAMPIIMILCLVLVGFVWAKTGLIVALLVFAALCSAGAAVAARWRQHSRGF
jgi:fatty acid desaturase